MTDLEKRILTKHAEREAAADVREIEPACAATALSLVREQEGKNFLLSVNWAYGAPDLPEEQQ